MTKRLIFLFILAMFLVSGTAFAENWAFVINDTYKHGKIYVDTDSIVRTGDTVIFWDKLEIRSPTGPGYDWLARWEAKLAPPLRSRELADYKINVATGEIYDRKKYIYSANPPAATDPNEKVFSNSPDYWLSTGMWQEEMNFVLQYLKDKEPKNTENKDTRVERWTVDPVTGGRIGIVFVYDDGSVLVSATWSGPVVDGRAEGKGLLNYVYRTKDGKETNVRADAEMKAGKLDGKTVVDWPGIASFDGYYRDGLREGRGVFRWANGQVYDGDWKAGLRDGLGVHRWPTGEIYEGDFKADLRDGRGIDRYPDGGVYDGGWKADKRSGYGVLKDAAGQVLYQGEWQDGQPAGQTGGQDASARGNLAGFLGIAWGAGKEEAEKIILARPDTGWYSKKYDEFTGNFGDRPALLALDYKDGKFFSGRVWLPATDDDVLKVFANMKSS